MPCLPYRSLSSACHFVKSTWLGNDLSAGNVICASFKSRNLCLGRVFMGLQIFRPHPTWILHLWKFLYASWIFLRFDSTDGKPVRKSMNIGSITSLVQNSYATSKSASPFSADCPFQLSVKSLLFRINYKPFYLSLSVRKRASLPSNAFPSHSHLSNV